MGVIRKASVVRGGCLLRLFTEGVSWSCDWLLLEDSRARVMFMPLRLSGEEKASLRIQGAKEVLELLLSHVGEDNVFVRWMTWGTVMLLLVLWCVQRFDAIGAAMAV